MSEKRINRRQFVASTGGWVVTGLASGVGTAAAECLWKAPKENRIPLGFDNFSIRALNWKADQLLDFAIEENLDSILFSDLDVYQNHNKRYLRNLAARAADNGVSIQAGTGGICPSSGRFIHKWGNATEHLELCLDVAQAVDSPVVRCYLGSQEDRKGEGGIQRHIDETVKTLKTVRSKAVEAGIKFAVENHAGDMQASELVGLIKAAGDDFVGATIDSGNATWTLENPLDNLEILGPYAISSGMRDSTVWQVEEGVRVAWNAVGEGQVDWKKYTGRFAELCPNVPFQLEIISGFDRLFPLGSDEFWQIFPEARALDYESFLAMARRGSPVAKGDSNNPQFQMAELKRSIRYCKQELGLGLKR